MPYLLFVTVLWAFSFSLIGEYLAGQVDSYFAVLTRVLLAGAVFLPLTRWRGVAPRFIGGVMLVGALQFGITYVCLYQSFRVLTVPEVLLFTVLTPLHVALIDDALNRRFNPWALLAAAVAVLGAAIIRYDGVSGDFVEGFLLLQLANATFAAGQSSLTLAVPLVNDGVVQPSRQLTLTVASGSGYLPGTSSSATVTIVDDDHPPGLALWLARGPSNGRLTDESGFGRHGAGVPG